MQIQYWFHRKSKGRQCKGRRPRNFDFLQLILNAHCKVRFSLSLQLDRTKRIYFGEETEAEAVRDKAKSAEDKARGRKKDMSSLFRSKAALKKQAGLLSAKEDELNIRSTGARNDYILNLSSSNAHQERYYRHDLQVGGSQQQDDQSGG